MADNRCSRSWQMLLVLGGAVVGYVAGQSGSGFDSARAEVRETTPRVAFQAGSERSESILREIAATLKTMDGRLERFEKVVGEKKTP